MSKTKIISHDCDHKYQDKVYGKGKRVMNAVVKTEGYWRCTVCGKDTMGTAKNRGRR